MLIAGLIATVATLVAVELISLVLARGGIYDRPNARSSHDSATLRGGGFGALLATLVAVAWSIPHLESVPWLGATTAITAFSLLGLLDDVRTIGALPRLAAQVVIGLSTLLWLPWIDAGLALQILAGAAAVFLIVAFVNAFNFMDGINGISAVNAAVAGAGFALMGTIEDLVWLQYLGAIFCGAAIGFLPHNFPTARIFLGDSGSYFFGAGLSILSVLAMLAEINPIAAIAPLWIYLADTGVTLIRRARRGENLLEAHREHTYQQLTNTAAGSMGSVAIVAAASVVLTLLGLITLSASAPTQVAVVAAMVAVTALYMFSPKAVSPRAVLSKGIEP